MTEASFDIEAGAAVRAMAISASRSIRYCSIGAIVGYGVLASCAWICPVPFSTATSTRLLPMIFFMRLLPQSACILQVV